MRRRSRLRNHFEYVLVRLIVATLEFSPRRAADRLARAYLALVDKAAPRLRRTARRNLAMAMPGMGERERERVIDGVFASLARLLVAASRFPQIDASNVRQWIEYEGLEHFQEAKRRGKGVLFAAAHLGNWELSAFAHGLMTEPMHVLVRRLDNPLLDRFVEVRRVLGGNGVIEKRDFARGILRALGRNEAVGILIDQNSSLEEGVFVDFFGVQACSNAGFVKIAARTGAAVIPGFALWRDHERRYVLRFYPPVEISGDPVSDTQRLQSLLEAVVREYPDQWLWIHRRWNTRPPGTPSIY